MKLGRLYFLGILIGFSVLLSAGSIVAQEAVHDQVQDSLVKLFASGDPQKGPFKSQPGGVESEGTGFFVGNDGYILTTAHFFNPLKAVSAVNTQIEAMFKGTGTGRAKVQFVAEISSLDLVLLRAIITNGIATPPSLEIGSSSDVDLGNPKLLTSGYDTTGYRRKSLEFNSTSNELAIFAWTMNGKTNSGASGSPVYVEKNGKPLVVGVIKATARDDDQFTLMIPIEYSFQLIGQFKLQELTEQVAFLTRVLGEISDEIPPSKPLNDRVVDIEDSVRQIEERFNWSAESVEKDGSIIVRYEKIIGGGPQIDEIAVKIKPTQYIKDDSTPGAKSPKVLATWAAKKIKRQPLDDGERIGVFKIPDVQKRLTRDVIENDGTTRDQEPYKDLELILLAEIGGNTIRKTINVTPKYTWKYDVE